MRNGADHVADQLRALLAQDFAGRWELIVVDNGSTDGTADVVDGTLRTHDHPHALQGVTVHRYGDRFGHASPRNYGARHAKGDVLAFCDADDAVNRSWLAELIAASGPNTIVASRAAPLVEDDVIEPTPAPSLFGYPVATTAGMAVERTTFERLDGFDRAFDRGGADADFSLRAHAAAISFAVADGAIHRLRPRDGGWGAVRQAYRYGRSRVQVYARHRDRLDLPASDPRVLLVRVRSIVLRLPHLAMRSKRNPYLLLVANTAARVVWSARLRVIYF